MVDDFNFEPLSTDPASEITNDNVHYDKESGVFQFDPEAAVKLVIDDTSAADNYINLLQWSSSWTLADTLYQSPQTSSAFDGGNVASANVPKFILSNHISSIVPKITGGIFYEDPPFLLRPRPGTTQEVIRAKTALFAYQLDDMKFSSESERFLLYQALFGTGIMKWGYLEYQKKIPKHQRKGQKLRIDTPTGQQEVDTPESDEFEIVYDDKTISRPWIKSCDLRTVLVDPGCRYGDIRRANWVVYRDYATYSDLSRLRDQDGYDIPDEEVLKKIFLSNPTSGPDNIAMTIPEGMQGYLQHALPRSYRTSADPMQTGIEMLERWDNEKVIVILACNGHNILIRNEANPYGKLPFLSSNWRDIPDCFYGQGLGQLIGAEQLVKQGITNLSLDLMAYCLQPTAVRKKGFNAPTQQIRWKQGGIIDVDEDVDKAFKFLQMPPVPGEAFTFLQQADSDAASASGANEQVVQGASSLGARSTGMRSGTGAAAVVAANASRLDGPSARFINQVFEPWLFELDRLNNDLLPTSVLNDVLGEELEKEFKVDHIEFRNARLEFEVLAGAHLGAKREMAQFLPIIEQIVNNPTLLNFAHDQGLTFNFKGFFDQFCAMAGFKFSQEFFVPMSDEQKQTYQQNKPAAIQQKQQQGQQALQTQKFQQEQLLEDQRSLGKAGAEVLRQSVEQAITPEEVQGEPGGTGFGSETGL